MGLAVLPAQPTPLLGRAAASAAVRRLLRRADVRLVTLSGPAGVGKTRLALHVAGLLHERFADGLGYVDLAPIRDPDLVIPTIAQAIGLHRGGRRSSLPGLLDALRARRLLLLLDNFEQILPAAPRLASLLAGCPALKLLVTSRAALRLRWEHLYAVPPLALPPRSAWLPGAPDVPTLVASPAVALFVRRARALDPAFALDALSAPAVAEVCTRLDGLPLAIELAAARSASLSPRTLARRLDPGPGALALLGAGPGDLPPRQRSLRAAIAWSYDLLPGAQQALFRCLAVFAGGCGLDAVRAVGGAVLPDSGEPGEGAGVVEGLSGLVAQSMLRRETGPTGQDRYVLLETLREYALERLEERGEAIAAGRLHAHHFLALAEAAAGGPEPAPERLAPEHDNLRQAMRWFASQEETGLALRLAGALFPLWHDHGHLAEGRRVLARLLALPPAGMPPAARAQALDHAGVLARAQGDYPAARALHRSAMALWEACGDRMAAAEARLQLGWVADQEGDSGAARGHYEAGLAVYRTLGDPRGVAWCRTCLGNLARARGDHGAARGHLEAALDTWLGLGDRGSAASSMLLLGAAADSAGDPPAARARYEGALALFRQLGDRHGTAWAVNSLGNHARLLKDYARARQCYEEGQAIARELGDQLGLSAALNNLAWLAYDEGDLDLAHALMTERLVLWRGTGNRRRIAVALGQLATVDEARGATAAARARYAEALAYHREAGVSATGGWDLSWSSPGPSGQRQSYRKSAMRWRGAQARFWESISRQSVAACLAGLGRAAAADARPRRAARLLAAAATLGGESAAGQALTGANTLRAALGETAWEAETAIGRAMTPDEALDYALRPAPPERSGAPGALPRQPRLAGPPALAAPHVAPAPLTARELQVAALISRGLTNRQIAHELIISTGTARTHVEHILGKLGLRSRTQVATWAAGRGMAEPAAS